MLSQEAFHHSSVEFKSANLINPGTNLYMYIIFLLTANLPSEAISNDHLLYCLVNTQVSFDMFFFCT